MVSNLFLWLENFWARWTNICSRWSNHCVFDCYLCFGENMKFYVTCYHFHMNELKQNLSIVWLWNEWNHKVEAKNLIEDGSLMPVSLSQNHFFEVIPKQENIHAFTFDGVQFNKILTGKQLLNYFPHFANRYHRGSLSVLDSITR